MTLDYYTPARSTEPFWIGFNDAYEGRPARNAYSLRTFRFDYDTGYRNGGQVAVAEAERLTENFT